MSEDMVAAKRIDECRIKSPLNMKEYFNKPEKTKEVVDADGWFASGISPPLHRFLPAETYFFTIECADL